MWKFRIPEFIVIIKYLKWKQKEIVCGVEKKRAEATQQQQIDGGNGKLHWASPK